MRYHSTNRGVPEHSFKEAVLKGLAADNGLFMPERMPRLPEDFFKAARALSFQEIALTAARAFAEDEIEETTLREIVSGAVSFDAPLKEVAPGIFSLELFHGPTLAFKDFGARFMARVMSHFARDEKGELTVLVATSGDTGSAVGSGFLNVPGIRVVLLYPSGKVSRVQEMQLTTFGGNVAAAEVDGSFDDCQRMVKEAFLDEELNRALRLSSANSINIARLIPQTFYYLRAWAQLPDRDRPPAVCVPSGNFGNLTAGLFALKMGMPAARFVAATNINDVVPEYLEGGGFRPRPSRRTISNAMDVGNPSNFARMLEIYGRSREKMQAEVCGCRYTDAETKAAMRAVYERHGYILDPHGAVAWLGLNDFLRTQGGGRPGIFLETAHPAKFYDIVEPVLGVKLTLPKVLADCLAAEKRSIPLTPDFGAFKRLLLHM